MKDWAERNSEDINKFAVFPTGYFGLVTPQNGLELYQGQMRLIGADGNSSKCSMIDNYLNIIAEHVENWSYLKFPYYKKLGFPGWCVSCRSIGQVKHLRKD